MPSVLDIDDDDEQVSGGFYNKDFESIDEINLDLDASQIPVTDQFVDMRNLTVNHILAPPGGENGQSFVQQAQFHFDMGEKLKFSDVIKAKQHYNHAYLLFREAAKGITDITTKKALCYLSDNAETMVFMLDKINVPTNSDNDSPSLKTPSSTHNEAPPLLGVEKGEILSESAYTEKVLNAPHHYDRIYTVLPMSTSMSFFGGFNTTPALSEENSRASLGQSRDRAAGVSSVPSMDLSASSSYLMSQSNADLSGAQMSKPMQQFLRDLRLLERRLGSIGLMPLTESAAAASLRDKEHASSKTVLTSSTARLNFLSSRLDESFIMLSQDGPNTSFRPSSGDASVSARNVDRSNSQPNPYGNSKRLNNTKTGGDHDKVDSESGDLSSIESSNQAGYWGAGILQMASKFTGIASNDGDEEKKNRIQSTNGLSSAPYGGAAAQQSRPQQKSSPDDVAFESTNLLHPDNVDVGESMQWNDRSMMLPPTQVPKPNKEVPYSAATAQATLRRQVDGWESVSSSGVLEGDSRPRIQEVHASTESGSEGVLRLLSTIERLSEENARLEKTVESLKSTQNKNSLLTAQIDQFKVEYKLKIDQMKSEMLQLCTKSDSSSKSQTDNIKESLPPDVKDKKLNELERTVNALLRKMTEMKHENEKKDEAIKHYKAKRDKRQKEKRDNPNKEQRGGKGNKPINGTSDAKGDQQIISQSTTTRLSEPSSQANAPSDSSSLSTRRGVAVRTVSTSAATAAATATGNGGLNVTDSGYSQATGYGSRSNSQNRNRISLTSASPSTATATLKTSLKREISAGSCYSPPKPNSSLRKGHQQPRK
mmetsp:Transcript_21169/g.39507  ORF Transcript_21169/g.39507 Transcript_21169/m.39507 type:complete len:823 (-) Transcript_21169:219-2687(-)